MKSLFSTLGRRIRQGLSIEIKPPKKSTVRKRKAAKKPDAKKAKMDLEPEQVFVITEELEREFNKEFADFDWSDPTEDDQQMWNQEELQNIDNPDDQQSWIDEQVRKIKEMEHQQFLQEEELRNLEMEEEHDAVTEFLTLSKQMPTVVKDYGHPLNVSVKCYLWYAYNNNILSRLKH